MSHTHTHTLTLVMLVSGVAFTVCALPVMRSASCVLQPEHPTKHLILEIGLCPARPPTTYASYRVFRGRLHIV